MTFTLAVLLGISTVGAVTDISALVAGKAKYQDLCASIDRDIKELQNQIAYLEESHQTLGKMSYK